MKRINSSEEKFNLLERRRGDPFKYLKYILLRSDKKMFRIKHFKKLFPTGVYILWKIQLFKNSLLGREKLTLGKKYLKDKKLNCLFLVEDYFSLPQGGGNSKKSFIFIIVKPFIV